MFYDRFIELCNSRGISPSKAAQEAGMNKSTVTYWKNHAESKPTGQLAEKLCSYFNISMNELYGENQIEKPADVAGISREQIKFAVFGDPDIDDELMDDVMSYARYKLEQRKKGK